ncbi:MAG: antitoxin Xre/MbcA/ParS toxin-binding domain-containing protein [Rhodospirillales bacterium]
MSPAAGVLPRYLEALQETGGLKDADIANIADVSKAAVSQWRQGSVMPHSRTQIILSDLHYIVDRLEEYYTPEETRAWLYARHPQLDGERAVDVICQKRAEEVVSILDRLDAGAYL